MDEVVGRQDARPHHIGTFRRLGAEVAERDADDHEDPEEALEQRPVASRLDPRSIKPRQHEQDQDRAEHGDDAAQLVGNRAQDRVERQIIPFRHDVRRRHQRIGFLIVDGVAEVVRREEHPGREEDQEHDNREGILHRVVGMEGQRVLAALHFDARGVVVARHVQRPDVQADDGGQHEGQQVVQREEAVERRVVDREAAPQPGGDRLAEERNGREQVGDDLGTPEAHLAPRQHVAHEGGGHHDEVDQHADHPQHFARRLVGTVVHAAEDVDVDGDEEHRCAVGMQVTQQPAGVHITHDVLDRGEGQRRLRRVVHHQHDAGDDLHHQHDGQDATEGPPVVQILRCWKIEGLALHQFHDGKARMHPLPESRRGLVIRGSAHEDCPS